MLIPIGLEPAAVRSSRHRLTYTCAWRVQHESVNQSARRCVRGSYRLQTVNNRHSLASSSSFCCHFAVSLRSAWTATYTDSSMSSAPADPLRGPVLRRPQLDRTYVSRSEP